MLWDRISLVFIMRLIMSDRIKMAVVGAGTWGENHIKIYNAHPFAEVVALCDREEKKLNEVATRQGVPQKYTDYKEMLEKSGCDAVAIVTPDFLHADMAIYAAECKKHILIEKPLATTAEDVHNMMQAIEKNGVRAMVDLHNRWSPPFNTTYQAVKSGELGEIYSAYFRLNDIVWVATDLLPWAEKSSILWFLGSHSLDTLRWLIDDEVEEVYSVSRRGALDKLGINTEDMYLTTLKFRSGVIAQMENGWVTPNGNPSVNDMKFTLLGSKGVASMDLSGHNLLQIHTEERGRTPDVLVQNSVFGQPKGFAFESIRSFVDCLITGKDFEVSLRDAANTSLTILKIMESAKTGQPIKVTGLY